MATPSGLDTAQEQFELLGWKLELQAPQGNPTPHTIINKDFT